MNTIVISDWEILGIITLNTGLAIALGIVSTLYVRLREQSHKNNRNTNQSSNINNLS
jgi:hypothetical protein